MHHGSAASTAFVDTSDVTLRDLERIESAVLRRAVEERLGQGLDLEPFAGFDSAI
jgi:hypothetical protein